MVADGNAGNYLISVPTGGGAAKGLGETFAPDLHTGRGRLFHSDRDAPWPQRPATSPYP